MSTTGAEEHGYKLDSGISNAEVCMPFHQQLPDPMCMIYSHGGFRAY